MPATQYRTLKCTFGVSGFRGSVSGRGDYKSRRTKSSENPRTVPILLGEGGGGCRDFCPVPWLLNAKIVQKNLFSLNFFILGGFFRVVYLPLKYISSFLLLDIGFFFLWASKKANLSFKSPSPKPHLNRTGSLMYSQYCLKISPGRWGKTIPKSISGAPISQNEVARKTCITTLQRTQQEVGKEGLVGPYHTILRCYRCNTTYRAILFKGG